MQKDKVTIQSGLDPIETERLRLDYEQYTRESERKGDVIDINAPLCTTIFILGVILTVICEWMGFK